MAETIADTAETNYTAYFDPKAYLQMYFLTPEGNPGEPGAQNFELNMNHLFYSKYHSQWDTSTAKILEFGGGPVISRLISGVPYVKEVVFAAHTKEEREEVEKWRDSKEDAHNWDPFFHYVNTLEHNDESAWKERESLLRNRMKKVIACDIKKEHPLESNVYKEEFDIIQTSLCLEAACQTYEEYKSALRKLAFMLKKGGYMAILAVEDETFYYVDQTKWHCLRLSLSQIEQALKEAGLEIEETHREPTSQEMLQNPTVSDFKAMLYLVAKKT